MKTNRKNGFIKMERLIFERCKVNIKFSPDSQHRIGDLVEQECRDLLEDLSNQAMNYVNMENLRVCLNLYYQQAVRLIDSIDEQLGTEDFTPQLLESCVVPIERFIDFLEKNYGKLIDEQAKISARKRYLELSSIERSFSEVVDQIPPEVAQGLFCKKFRESISTERFASGLSRRSLDYLYQVVFRLKHWNWNNAKNIFSAMEQFLIYVNFNSKEVMDALVGRIIEQLEGKRVLIERYVLVRDFQKAFNQLHRKPGMVLNPGYISLENYVNNWFENEISYYTECLQLGDLGFSQKKAPIETSPQYKHKLKCNLSSDQIAIYLRLLDEERLVEARSLNQVYQTLVPMVSSTNRDVLSPSSVRIKSYHPEQRDKFQVIEVLEKMIKRVRDF